MKKNYTPEVYKRYKVFFAKNPNNDYVIASLHDEFGDKLPMITYGGTKKMAFYRMKKIIDEEVVNRQSSDAYIRSLEEEKEYERDNYYR